MSWCLTVQTCPAADKTMTRDYSARPSGLSNFDPPTSRHNFCPSPLLRIMADQADRILCYACGAVSLKDDETGVLECSHCESDFVEIVRDSSHFFVCSDVSRYTNHPLISRSKFRPIMNHQSRQRNLNRLHLIRGQIIILGDMRRQVSQIFGIPAQALQALERRLDPLIPHDTLSAHIGPRTADLHSLAPPCVVDSHLAKEPLLLTLLCPWCCKAWNPYYKR